MKKCKVCRQYLANKYGMCGKCWIKAPEKIRKLYKQDYEFRQGCKCESLKKYL